MLRTLGMAFIGAGALLLAGQKVTGGKLPAWEAQVASKPIVANQPGPELTRSQMAEMLTKNVV